MKKLPFVYCLLAVCISLGRLCSYAQGQVRNSVLAHYAKTEDSLRLRAAVFLLDNMRAHGAYSSNRLEQYYVRCREIGKDNKPPQSIDLYRQAIREIGDLNEGLEYIPDTMVLKAEDIIASIDLAFADWQKGRWARHLSFEDFCEWLLPYRVCNEVYEPWRKSLRNVYSHEMVLLDSCDERSNSTYWAARAVCDAIKSRGFRVDDKAQPSTKADLPVSVLLAMGMGECMNYARLTTYAMRACGLPVCVDYTPQWPNKAHRHSWNVLLGESGHIVPFLGAETYPGEWERTGEKMAKVYRQTFAWQHQSVAAINDTIGEMLPPTLNNPFMLDVSDEYFEGASVCLTLPKGKLKRRIAYLAVFDNSRWVPVDFSLIDTANNVSFFCLGREIVYMPVYWGRNGSVPCDDPLLVRADGGMTRLTPDSERTFTLNINRKYPVFGRIHEFAKSLRGGYIEAANEVDFKDAVRTASVDKIPSVWFNTITLDTIVKRRFWRFVAPRDSHCDLAELAFIGNDGHEIDLVDTLCDDMLYDRSNIPNAFDGNALTYFRSRHYRKAWIGGGAEFPIEVAAVRFMPRNDDNHVQPGHTYQLCYYLNGREMPHATATATTDRLTFNNVPSGALYILHDLTAGTEERVFIVEDGKIKWY